MPALFNKYFSYCLPSSASSPGYITIGKTADNGIKNKFLKFTPLTTKPQDKELYGIVVTGISVGGKNLSVKSSDYMKSGAIIDSGTTFAYLPQKAYITLEISFVKQISEHNKLTPLSDDEDQSICLDLSTAESFIIPKISISFKGGVELELDVKRILSIINKNNKHYACLAFRASTDKTEPLILGNVQQRATDVRYDVAGGKVGFGPGGCS
ncbi:aspartyl protease family protein At5g10770-like [Pistacia vera]|uniref:aspartyl protease family protein At5g10770-like n=1 Tax=Pistacia vera TaxID=55513 RepID=UPI001263AF47|nr:aspartyl protease family protein At5g10770-like [Pistacia vera]